MRRLVPLLLCLSLPIFAQKKSADDIKAAVTRMARVGRCSYPSFSPDGKTLAVICDMSGCRRSGRCLLKAAGPH